MSDFWKENPQLKPYTCACGKRCVWAINAENGKRVLLDPQPAVYAIARFDQDPVRRGELVPVVERRQLTLVNHFSTCSKAADFHKKPPQREGA